MRAQAREAAADISRKEGASRARDSAHSNSINHHNDNDYEYRIHFQRLHLSVLQRLVPRPHTPPDLSTRLRCVGLLLYVVPQVHPSYLLSLLLGILKARARHLEMRLLHHTVV